MSKKVPMGEEEFEGEMGCRIWAGLFVIAVMAYLGFCFLAAIGAWFE